MFLKRGPILLLFIGMALILTGCFRQASEPFETVDDSEANAPQSVEETPLPTIPVLTDTPEDNQPTTDDDSATPTEETMDDMGDDTETQTPADDDDSLPTLPPPVTSTPFINPTNTVESALPDDEPVATNASQPIPTQNNQQDDDDDPVQAGVTPTFITPGVPAGQDTQTDPTPVAPNSTPPSATPSGLVTPTDFLNPDNLPSQCVYVVQPGDNLFRIGLNNGVTLEQLRAANPQISGDIIQPGDRLALPIEGCQGATGGATTEEDTAQTTPAAPSNQVMHTVANGETLGSIARRYGTTITAITEANNLTDPNRLSIGQQLVIPTE